MLDTRDADSPKPVFAKAGRYDEPDGCSPARVRRTTSTLSNAHLRLEIAAGMHCGIVQMEWNDRGTWTPVFRPPKRADRFSASCEPACQPLIRIPDATKVIQLQSRSNAVRSAGASHEQIMNGWDVDYTAEKSLRLSTDVAECYRAVQTYELDGPTLEITVELENIGYAPLRCGIDIAPVLVRDQDTRISAPAGGIWIAGRSGNAPRLVPTPFAWQFGVTHPLPAMKVDHAFSGWGGKALVEWPLRQFSLEIVGNTDGYRLRAHPEDDSFSFQVVNEQSEHSYIGQGDDVRGLTALPAGKTLIRRVSFTVERLVSLTKTTRQPSD